MKYEKLQISGFEFRYFAIGDIVTGDTREQEFAPRHVDDIVTQLNYGYVQVQVECGGLYQSHIITTDILKYKNPEDYIHEMEHRMMNQLVTSLVHEVANTRRERKPALRLVE